MPARIPTRTTSPPHGLLTRIGVLAIAVGLSGCTLLEPEPVRYDKVHLPSGLAYRDLVVPDEGRRAQAGDVVAIDYELFLEDGEQVDSTYDRGRPARFTLGAGEVPPGIEEGVVGMRLYGQRRVIVPPELAYGEDGKPPRIPAGATLRFELELMELEESEGLALGDSAPDPAE